jgi:predicted dehydrogenase
MTRPFRRRVPSAGPVTSFAVVGAGFRAAAYWRLAAHLPGLSCVGAVVRSPRPVPVPAYASVGDCLAAARPDFLVTSLPRTVNPDVLLEALGRGVPVLSETPPAGDLAALRSLWAAAGDSGLVQVAEQYLRMPTHAARAAAVRQGLIGTPTQVQISSTQLHHAVSLIRGLLGVGRGPVTVRATRHEAPLLDPLTRAGWTDNPPVRLATTTIAMLDFGDGRTGLYDFTTNQTRNQLRFRRILVRGSHGELRDDEIVRLAGPATIVRFPLQRPARAPGLNDDEIATAATLEAMAAWVHGEGPAPYPLAEGIQDQVFALAIEEASNTGRTVVARPLT